MNPGQLPASGTSADITATFCAVLVDEWIRSGVTVACVSPGSRSTPMALALADRPEMRIEIFHDERSAAFAALGVGSASGTPAVLLCTSGTAAAHFHAAVVEADLSGVPLLVVTADRPPELVDVGAPQTIDQTKLYGDAVRWFHAPGVPDAAAASTWRSLGARVAAEARGVRGRPGPVHLNLAFREPLVGTPAALPPGRKHDAPWHSVVRSSHGSNQHLVDALVDAWENKRGVFLVGRGSADPTDVLDLAELLGWPVFAEHRSGCCIEGRAIRHFDSLVRSPAFAQSQRPEIVVRVGELPASKVTSQWVTASGAHVHCVVDPGQWIDPDHAAGAVIVGSGVIGDMRDTFSQRPRPAFRYSDVWEQADRLAASAIERTLIELDQTEVTEPSIARAALRAVPPGGAFVVSSSMPVRDVEWFGAHRNDVAVRSNRGANGIDGVIATAIGVALTGVPTVCLLGDIAFVHDSSSLTALRSRAVDLTIVVTDNDGGAIFSFLPQATALPVERYEQLFGTPHGTDLVALAEAHGLATQTVTAADHVQAGPGVKVLVARTSRNRGTEVHRALHTAVAAALDTLNS